MKYSRFVDNITGIILIGKLQNYSNNTVGLGAFSFSVPECLRFTCITVICASDHFLL